MKYKFQKLKNIFSFKRRNSNDLKPEILKDIKKMRFELKKNHGISTSSNALTYQLTKTNLLFKEIRGYNYFFPFKEILQKHPNLPATFISQVNSYIPKVNRFSLNDFVNNGVKEILLSYSKPEITTFNKDLSKLFFFFENTKLSSNKGFEKYQKSQEYLKYLIRTGKFSIVSEKQILIALERINAGLINTKITSSVKRYTCSETYRGFIRSIKTRNLYFLEYNGKTYVVKTHIGHLRDHDGKNKLALDPITLDVYSFKMKDKKIVFSKKPVYELSKHRKEISKGIISNLYFLRKNYIKYYKNKSFKNEKQRALAVKRIKEIFSTENIKKFVEK